MYLMKLQIKSRKQQKEVSLFGGRLLENKPIAGDPLYSNLIYWANVEALEEGTFPMHPHEGIEILTFVFEGGLEHFDTASNAWTPLNADAVQHIKAGSGIQHSEKYLKGSRAFQIWFNPDYSKSLKKNPYYKDYPAQLFNWVKEGELEVKSYVGKGSPIQTDASGISVKRYKIPAGQHSFNLDANSFHSLYVMEGEINIMGSDMRKDSFTKVSGITKIDLIAKSKSELFILKSPIDSGYDNEG
ncbi:MAG: hypothetical protein COA49_04000 [Bacteroidetes bacterium]|nr:MAG: hypothetical protein COA49_04000 [Bacteroidota bacterium]